MTRTARLRAGRDRSSAGRTPSTPLLEHELAYLVRALEAVQRKRAYPLERAQYLLLGILEREGPQAIGSLAERLFLDDSTVTRQVAAMQLQALIERDPNPKDGRSTLVRATQRGIRIAARMRDIRLGRIAVLFDDWSEAERSALASLLAKLNLSLQRSLSS
jgi:DNA-binding MarR family transcriptional regulator